MQIQLFFKSYGYEKIHIHRNLPSHPYHAHQLRSGKNYF